MTEFDGVVPALDQALRKRGYTVLTPVQEAVLAPELGSSDLLVSAQTGSGKTHTMHGETGDEADRRVVRSRLLQLPNMGLGYANGAGDILKRFALAEPQLLDPASDGHGFPSKMAWFRALWQLYD